MSDILKRSISEHADALERKEYSSVELTGAFLERIERENSEINAYVTVARESALNCARESDERRARGEARGALDGIPYAAKDNIAVRGLRLSCASGMLENYISPYDASVVSILRDAGAVLLGKTNLDEFAMGTGTESSHFGRAKIRLTPTEFRAAAAAEVPRLWRLIFAASRSDRTRAARYVNPRHSAE